MLNYNYRQTPLTRSLLSGLTAVMPTDFIYWGITRFALLEVVNITFFSLITGMTGGAIYFTLRKMNRYRLVYEVLFVVLIIVGIITAIGIQRTSDPVQQHQVEILFDAVILITGLCTAFLVPYFANHYKIYNES